MNNRIPEIIERAKEWEEEYLQPDLYDAWYETVPEGLWPEILKLGEALQKQRDLLQAVKDDPEGLRVTSGVTVQISDQPVNISCLLKAKKYGDVHLKLTQAQADGQTFDAGHYNVKGCMYLMQPATRPEDAKVNFDRAIQKGDPAGAKSDAQHNSTVLKDRIMGPYSKLVETRTQLEKEWKDLGQIHETHQEALLKSLENDPSPEKWEIALIKLLKEWSKPSGG